MIPVPSTWAAALPPGVCVLGPDGRPWRAMFSPPLGVAFLTPVLYPGPTIQLPVQPGDPVILMIDDPDGAVATLIRVFGNVVLLPQEG